MENCPLSLPGKETAPCYWYNIGLVEFTLFSDFNRKTINGQLDSYSCHSRTHNKNLWFDVSISNINVASTKQTPWKIKWNVIGSEQNIGHHRENNRGEDKNKDNRHERINNRKLNIYYGRSQRSAKKNVNTFDSKILFFFLLASIQHTRATVNSD